MSEMAIGTSALPTADAEQIRQAGIGWVRQGFRFPFADRVGGEITEAYRKARWQCGSPDCPIETAWGLVDGEGKPKPSLTAFKEGVDRLVG